MESVVAVEAGAWKERSRPCSGGPGRTRGPSSSALGPSVGSVDGQSTRRLIVLDALPSDLLHGLHPGSRPDVPLGALKGAPVDPSPVWTVLFERAGSGLGCAAVRALMGTGDECRHARNLATATDIQGPTRRDHRIARAPTPAIRETDHVSRGPAASAGGRHAGGIHASSRVVSLRSLCGEARCSVGSGREVGPE